MLKEFFSFRTRCVPHGGRNQTLKSILIVSAICLAFAQTASAQTTAFTYQGKLTDGGLPATAQYDFTFKLYDSASGGTQVGANVTVEDLQVTAGIFTVNLNYGASPFTSVTGNFLEISVRPGASTGAYTMLVPRQPITSSPYAVQTIRAASAEVADNAAQLGGVNASQYVQTNDSRLSDDRNPLPNSPNYVQNTTTQQAASNFNVSGNGTVGGTLTGNVVNATTQFNIGGNRILSNAGSVNLFAGVGAGQANTTGSGNSFFGYNTGQSNTTGYENSFFGRLAGLSNTTGVANSFFGIAAGAGNTTGFENSFFGRATGVGNTTGVFNSFFGRLAGQSNTIGSSNTLIGSNADVSANNLDHATAIGADSIVSSSNTIVLGRNLDTVRIPGAMSVAGSTTFGGTLAADIFNATTQYNIGGNRILSNAGSVNLFAGVGAGQANTTGSGNSFFGYNTGQANTTGYENSFFGRLAGLSNTTGVANSFFGIAAGAGTTTGFENSFFGRAAGVGNTTGVFNSFFGRLAGQSNTIGSSNTLIGSNADVSANNLNYATAIGADSIVSSSNTIVLGRNLDTVRIPGNLNVNTGLRVQTNTSGGTVASFGGNGAFQIDAPGIVGGRFNVAENGNIGVGTNAPNAKLQVAGGNVYIAQPNSLIITSPNGTCWFITVSDTGVLSSFNVPCP